MSSWEVEPTYTSDIKVRLIQSMGGDHMVVAAARVSVSGEEAAGLGRMACPIHFPGHPDYSQCDHCRPYRDRGVEHSGLINYLMKHRHGTPFEHSAVTFFVHAPIFVWREWHRHRIGFSYNEESGRYKTLDPVFYIPPRDRPMMKVDSWKPGRPKFLRCEDEGVFNGLVNNLKYAYECSYQMYLANLALNVDPGLARDCLPVGIYSSCWVTCNPRSLMAFLSLRTHDEKAKFVSYPLYEIEVAARAAETILAAGWPVTYSAFIANGRVGP